MAFANATRHCHTRHQYDWEHPGVATGRDATGDSTRHGCDPGAWRFVYILYVILSRHVPSASIFFYEAIIDFRVRAQHRTQARNSPMNARMMRIPSRGPEMMDAPATSSSHLGGTTATRRLKTALQDFFTKRTLKCIVCPAWKVGLEKRKSRREGRITESACGHLYEHD
uniref:Uncharacterized protein n=1 Tax=Branchiostoma floridae TaxID=7739 RepID=C3XWU8_BRAFL|eukprot:XP_002611198.1 hypothetical protein BRAFLDRAFT_71158 [Branchiostoma floridae]